MSCELPEVYRVRRPLHDDWPWPFSLIPRKWTGRCFPMPPKQLAGNAPLRWMPIQQGYPLVPNVPCQMLNGHTCHTSCTAGSVPVLLLSPDPVPPLGCWSVQAVYSTWLSCWIPCYVAASFKLFGQRVHFNGFLKPDVTPGDWFWWFECSLTWTKIVP